MDLFQKFQEYKFVPWPQSKETLFLMVAVAPTAAQKSNMQSQANYKAAFAQTIGLSRLLLTPNPNSKTYHSNEPKKEETKPKTEYESMPITVINASLA